MSGPEAIDRGWLLFDASVADLFETGFHHFFHARTEQHQGDLVFFQPHSAPGVYARAFLEGRLSEEQLLGSVFEDQSNGLVITVNTHSSSTDKMKLVRFKLMIRTSAF